jgi:tetratricopeptide (TPR) repeat protein
VTRQPESRKRGVRASRAKLYRALTKAGLKTQAALANRIADLEQLDAAPTDTINRVFREVPVEVQTMERVARALGVDAYSLYRSSDDAEALDVREDPTSDSPHDDQPPATATVPGRRVRPVLLFGGIFLGVVAAALIWVTAARLGDHASGDDSASVIPRFNLGTPRVVVLPVEGDTDGTLAKLLRDRLRGDFNVASVTANILTRSLRPPAAATLLHTELTVTGELIQVGRLVGIRFYLLSDGVRRQIWAESFPAVTLPARREEVADRVAYALRDAAGMAVESTADQHFPTASAQDDYLAGQRYLDEPANELNIKRAQSRFNAALRKDRRYAQAHAGLCEALLEEHWMHEEESVLHDAAEVCTRGLEFDADDPVVGAAHAHFLRRTGRNEQAIELYEQLVAREPGDSWARNGLASSLLHAFRKHGDRKLLSRAIEAARTASEVDPYTWKPAFFLGTLEWFAGNVRGAIRASEQALERDENEFVLANLGTFYLCDGEYLLARDAYLRAQDVAPESYVGDEFLGQAYYYLGDFERSAKLRRKAIERISNGEPEIHEMWGNLGDSMRHAGDTEGAVAAYLQAAEILERDALRGNAPLADQAARAFYYTMLHHLDPQQVSDSQQLTVAAQLDEAADSFSEPAAHIRAAQTWLHLGQTDKAEEAMSRAMETCRGYRGHPDLASLAADGR